MGEEQARMNVFCQMQKVRIIPGRMRVAIDARRRIITIPAHAESIAVETFHVLRSMTTLIDQRMIGAGQYITQSE